MLLSFSLFPVRHPGADPGRPDWFAASKTHREAVPFVRSFFRPLVRWSGLKSGGRRGMLLCQIFRLDGERWMDGRYGSGDVGGSEVARVI